MDPILSLTHVPIWRMDCRSRCFSISLCLSDQDLRALGTWTGLASPDGLSAAAWSRTYVQVECREQNEIANAVQDLLDLRCAGWIQQVRDTPRSDLPELFRECVAAELRDADGLFWALATDSRKEAQRLAGLLGQEVFTRCCQVIGG